MEFFVWKSHCFKRIEKEKRTEIRLFFFLYKKMRTENGDYTDTSVLRRKRCYDVFTETKEREAGADATVYRGKEYRFSI